MRRDVGVIIPAAGSGSRAGTGAPKQYRELGGHPVLLRSLRPFLTHPNVCHVAIATPPESDEFELPSWLKGVVGERVVLVPGGATRAHSVRNGLEALSAECEIVLVHDGARPLVSSEIIDDVVAMVRSGRAGVAAVPLVDTIKRVEPGEHRVIETLDRSVLWRAQTPQGMPRRVLVEAYQQVDLNATQPTDEAALLEAVGYPVHVVPDSPKNMKVTTADDFLVAEALVRL